MSGLLQRAWDWLAPPEVPLVDGQLVKRPRRGASPPAGQGHAPAPVALQLELDPLPDPTPAAVVAAPPRIELPVAFVHPQASHHLRLSGIPVSYLLERSRRRSIGMTVGVDGLRVRAPLSSSLGAVERVLQDKADWIVRKLAEQKERGEEAHSARLQWGAQTVLPFLGGTLQVARVMPGPGVVAAQLQPASGALQLALAADAPDELVRGRVHAWWLHTARSHFTERLDHFAPQLGVQWRSLRLSSARTRWGSARSDGAIRLNWRLLHYAPEVIDYVVVHELSHLRHMDHSARFWATVASVLPDYRALRQRLRDQPAPMWADDDA
ncbi:SprT family zinc-dependent metalloprotease [Acidovorax sp. CCYZU-2555]|uniref:M48 family metallopeptidase n=1 Tax=Acidovorax sp. CCYZU-2555 TaxID=2835042 RepID=UPI001BCAC887|nr:SprT family zinc-dependent metalloprotease [Acidovorax sp. CCYZU-2555]MBS7777070.1 M48 family metallopeptidase [Acidovorax sp. CCYZU-2555]